MPKLGGPRAHNRLEAEIEELVRALRTYGVLTRSGLEDTCGASHWSGPHFERVLATAVRSGRIRKLTDELYELEENHPT